MEIGELVRVERIIPQQYVGNQSSNARAEEHTWRGFIGREGNILSLSGAWARIAFERGDFNFKIDEIASAW